MTTTFQRGHTFSPHKVNGQQFEGLILTVGAGVSDDDYLFFPVVNDPISDI